MPVHPFHDRVPGRPRRPPGSRIALVLAGLGAVAVGCTPALAGARNSEASRAEAAKTTSAVPSIPALPVAVDLAVTGDGSATTVGFTLSTPLEPKVSVLEKPDRIVLDLPEVNFQIPADAAKRTRGLVKSVRFGLIGPGRSRAVIELAQPALPGRVANRPVLGGAASALEIPLARAERDAFARAAAADRAESLAAQAKDAGPTGAAPPKDDARPVVVLDPGHGGIDVGATGLNDTLEKEVVFAFAQALKAKLEKAGLVRVVMTRDSDTFVSLSERVKLAQSLGASLFVSIHADTVKASPEVRGLTVYTNSERASDAEAARLAESENRADQAAGLEASDDGEDVSGILGDLLRRETRTYSHLFAKALVGQITAASRLNKNPERSARFLVLRAPDVPSVLIELGYLSSKSDVELLRADGWRDKAAESVAAAVTGFLSPRLAQGAPAAPAQVSASP
jgi:N-acetylmuramoyl-L-alanine amidase